MLIYLVFGKPWLEINSYPNQILQVPASVVAVPRDLQEIELIIL